MFYFHLSIGAHHNLQRFSWRKVSCPSPIQRLDRVTERGRIVNMMIQGETIIIEIVNMMIQGETTIIAIVMLLGVRKMIPLQPLQIVLITPSVDVPLLAKTGDTRAQKYVYYSNRRIYLLILYSVTKNWIHVAGGNQSER